MICTDCKIDKPNSDFTTGKHRCCKCQYQYQKKRADFVKRILKPIKMEVKNYTPEQKVAKLLELHPHFSEHDLSFIFDCTKKIIIETLKSLNVYYVYCFHCHQYKIFSEFSKSENGTKVNGLQSWCKICLSSAYFENKKHYQQYQRQFYEQNKELLKEYQDKYRFENPGVKREYNKKWFKRQYHTNPKFKLDNTIGNLIYKSLSGNKDYISWKKLVPYTLDELIDHLEWQFQEGMTWDNYGQWHVDHKIPRSSFQYLSYDDEEFLKCWALENLQQLWAADNIRKSDKVEILK